MQSLRGQCISAQPHRARPKCSSVTSKPTVLVQRLLHASPRRPVGCRSLSLDAEDLDTPIADLEQALKRAVTKEDFKSAARLRDAIQQKQSISKLAVEDANRRFYDAFMSGRVEEMDKIVGLGEHVQVVHPGSATIAGRAQVMDSWRAIMRNVRPGAFKVVLEDVRVYAREDFGYVTCVEIIDADDSAGRLRWLGCRTAGGLARSGAAGRAASETNLENTSATVVQQHM
ncbi:hypothetical protein CHLRE_08g375950v5 [Chlamydomonas reinhardtii]|uniref:UVR domain-containing protein n=1 Tax=Chlamydomonas reinhardtii TaxID=3055 RepID=A0A2K3DHP6_CHLRE|nr:uncharacterized protein CHLRE_08g375950v5 [Chlamydomonas reinhardtii]PNW80054.1 hypothetical protein CHLRE_08g375950v5 [Chlamydomonas reinhardtii]